jgi:hypothetical protein
LVRVQALSPGIVSEATPRGQPRPSASRGKSSSPCPYRTLNIIDESNGEGLVIEIGTTLPSVRVIAVPQELVAVHDPPQSLASTTGRSSPRSP